LPLKILIFKIMEKEITIRKSAHKVHTTEKPIKWTAKLQKAFDEKEFYVGDINNFWRE